MPSIRVVIRFRPINGREKRMNESLAIPMEEEEMVPYEVGEENYNLSAWTEYPRVPKTHYKFTFDHVLWSTDQETAFKNIALPLCTDFVSGINGTIFAYGQSGSGKSFTMFGKEPEMYRTNAKGKRVAIPIKEIKLPEPELQGLIPRSCSYTFAWVKNNIERIKTCNIYVSFYEIYIQGQLRDLLDEGSLLVNREFSQGVELIRKGMFQKYKNLKTRNKALITKKKVKDLKEMIQQFVAAQRYRTVKATKLNPFSSRGHCIMRFYLDVEFKPKQGEKKGECYSSMFNFADLAGCEKVSKSGATDDLLVEAKYINQSLTILGQVISALARIGKKGPAPPFRDSVLSHCLKDSLVGNTRTSVVVAASPHCDNVVETVSSLKFGKRCKAIKTKVKRNVNMSAAQMRKLIAKQKEQIEKLKKQLAAGGHGDGKPYGPALIFHTPSPNILNDEEQKAFKKKAKDFFMSFSKDVGISSNQYKVKLHINPEPETTDLGIYLEKDEEHEMTDLLEFRDKIMAHASRLQETPDCMFVGAYEAEDPLDPGLLAHWKSENQDLKETQKELTEKASELQQELEIEVDRVEHLNRQIEELKASSGKKVARKSMMVRLGELELMTEDVGQMNQSIETFIAHVESVVGESADDAPSVLVRKAVNMLKIMQGKVQDLSEEKTELEESLDVMKQRYDQVMTNKDFYQEQLSSAVQVARSSQIEIDIEDKRRPKVVNTAAFWKKLAKKGDEASFRQLVMDTAKNTEYLDKLSQSYFTDKKGHERNATMAMNDLFDDEDFQGRVIDMTTKNVQKWIMSLNDGAFKDFTEHFGDKTGTDLLTMDKSHLSTMGMDPRQSAVVLDAIQTMHLDLEAEEEEEDEDDMQNGEINAYEKILSEFHAPEIGLLQQLKNIDIEDLFDANEYIGFKEVLHALDHIIQDKSILCKIFSLIDTRQAGIISTTKLTDFIKAIQDHVIENRVFTDVSPYTNYHTILKAHTAHAKLDRDGARMIVAEFRSCNPKEIRESDIAIDYLVDLNEDQLREFLESCPKSAWNTLSTFHPFEKLIRIIEASELESPTSEDPSKCDLSTFAASFKEAGIDEIDEDKLMVAFTTTGVDYSVPFNFFLAFNLLNDPLSDTGEIQDVIGDRTTVPIANPKNRIVAPAVWLAKRKERDAELAGEMRAARLAKAAKELHREKSTKGHQDQLASLEADFADKVMQSNMSEMKHKNQEEMLKAAMGAVHKEKSDMAVSLQEEIARLKAEVQAEKAEKIKLAAARHAKSVMFHQKEDELSAAAKELDAMKEIYEQDMQVSAEDREKRQVEIMQAHSEIEKTKLEKLQALNEKEQALQKGLEEQRLMKEHEVDMLAKYNQDLQRREESLRKQEQLRNQLVAQADWELAMRLQKEFDMEENKRRENRQRQMAKDKSYASKLNSKVKPGVRHARGVSNAEQSRFGTVRKKVAADIRMNEQVKTSKNFKGVVKFDGEVPGLGHVLGLAIFLGRGNHDGKYNGKRYFKCKKGRGLFVPLKEITHVYRENKHGEKEKIRFEPPQRARMGEEGGLAGIGEDDMMMQNAMSHLGSIEAVPPQHGMSKEESLRSRARDGLRANYGPRFDVLNVDE
jgi:hypothetical protein